MSTLESVTTLTSCAAVLVALVAVGVGWKIAQGDLDLTRLVDRQRALVDLLAAFEAMQAYRTPVYREGDSDNRRTTAAETHPREFEEIRARYRASLYASGEPLPYTRQAAFSHFGPGEIPPGARQEGNPEVDAPEVCTVRGEMVEALDRLRDEIQG